MTMTANRISSDLQRRKLEHRFSLIDQDNDGFIWHNDCERLFMALCTAFGETLESPKGKALVAGYNEMFDALVKHVDADQDGRISKEEFVTGLSTVIGDPEGFDCAMGAASRAMLSMADTDGDGILDSGEYARLVGAFGVSDQDAAYAFALLDRDGDGKLTLDELFLAEKEFFTSSDQDVPGNYFFGRF